MKDFALVIGNRIRYYRTNKKLTQDELADLAQMHTTYIGQIERGEKNVTAINLDKILNALHISYMDFFEPFDIFKRDDNSTAVRCYDLIREQPESQQKRILRVIEEIYSIIEHT